MIYTTYFAKLKSLPKEITPVAICAKAPPGIPWPSYRTLAPNYGFYSVYKETGDTEYFTRCYRDGILSNLNPVRVVADLYSRAGKAYLDGDIALVCYEKSTDFCHRHLVADWLNKNGYKAEELNI